MPNAALIGLSSQMALRRELDSIANNIANVNTTGFKADRVVFQEHLAPIARENRFSGSSRGVSFVEDAGSWRNYGQGPVVQTGNPLDVAIDGDAFLVVQTADGERYTRAGSLQINAQGQLVTLDGSVVVGDRGPVTFQPLDRDIVITPDGRITTMQGNEKLNDSQRGRLRLVSFTNPQLLLKEGTNTYSAPAGAGLQPAPASVKVIQGSLEKSNVSTVVEMTRMIDVTRTYTAVANLLSQHNDMRKSAIERLAEVPS